MTKLFRVLAAACVVLCAPAPLAAVEPITVFAAASLTDALHVYPAAIVKGADSASVQKYYRYLRSPQARSVFLRYGFKVQ